MAVPKDLLTDLVTQHGLAWAKLLGEVEVAFDKTLAAWAPVCPDPMRIPGGTLCSDVRTRVLLMNGIDARSRFDDPPQTPPEGASCGPGSTLKMTSGPSSSVRLGDTKKVAWARLRHLPPQEAEDIGALTPQPIPATQPGRQMAFDAAEMESEPQVMGPPGIGDQYEFIAYWWESPGRLSVAGAILAMVADIDTKDERIVEFIELPPAIRPKTAAELAAHDYSDDEDVRDFEDLLPPESPSETGDSEA